MAVVASLVLAANGSGRPPVFFLRAGFAFTPQLGSPREKTLKDGRNTGTNSQNLHERPPVPIGGSSYLSAIGMPVVEPMMNHIWALLQASPSKLLGARGYFPFRPAVRRLSANPFTSGTGGLLCTDRQARIEFSEQYALA